MELLRLARRLLPWDWRRQLLRHQLGRRETVETMTRELLRALARHQAGEWSEEQLAEAALRSAVCGALRLAQD